MWNPFKRLNPQPHDEYGRNGQIDYCKCNACAILRARQALGLESGWVVEQHGTGAQTQAAVALLTNVAALDGATLPDGSVYPAPNVKHRFD